MLFDAVFTGRLFGRPALFSDQPRSLARILDVDRMRGSGGALLGSELVATFGLLVVIWGCSYGHPSATPYAGRRLYYCGVTGSLRPHRSQTQR
jgi:hypothetical protein